MGTSVRRPGRQCIGRRVSGLSARRDSRRGQGIRILGSWQIQEIKITEEHDSKPYSLVMRRKSASLGVSKSFVKCGQKSHFGSRS
jgi:hypothetical protein